MRFIRKQLTMNDLGNKRTDGTSYAIDVNFVAGHANIIVKLLDEFPGLPYE